VTTPTRTQLTGTGFQLCQPPQSLSRENLAADRAVFAMSPAVRAYVQVGLSLKPHGADDGAILRKTRFPGKLPLWIPMPPH
jgi:hypothetical protein